MSSSLDSSTEEYSGTEDAPSSLPGAYLGADFGLLLADFKPDLARVVADVGDFGLALLRTGEEGDRASSSSESRTSESKILLR
jgi:hypothetical protein